MAKEKKTQNPKSKREKELEEMVENLEEKLHKIEEVQKLEESIKEKKDAIKTDIENQLKSQNKTGDHFDDMVKDYIKFVEYKERLKHDIDINGLRYRTTTGNGFTTYKPNESYERLVKTNAQMLKIRQDLGINVPKEEGEEEGDDLL